MHLILGAGCAGLTLALALVDEGLREPIVLVDRRTQYTDDRTWCFWAAGADPTRYADPAHRWTRWQTIARDGRAVVQSSIHHPYLQVDGADFYAAALERLGRAPNVELRLGETVLALEAQAGGMHEVRTSAGMITAGRVYDAMGGAGPLLAGRPPGSIELRQSFLGLEVETSAPAFDPEVATLMDFRAGGPGTALAGDGGLHFIYLLPTSPTRALVEHTTLGPGTIPAPIRREAIAEYLEGNLGVDRFAVVREERGVLPMTTYDFPLVRPSGILAVGSAAGAVRPSSGYAFVRIQRHAQALARAVARSQPPPRSLGQRRRATLDQLFLRALAVDPEGFDETLLALARGVPGPVFARFMSDASSRVDEARIMAALARPSFLGRMATSSLLRPAGPEFA